MQTDLGTLRPTGDGRFLLRFERRLRHPPARVWRAITDPEQLAAWFPAIVHGGLAAGAPLRFELPPATVARLGLAGAPVGHGEVVHADPPRLLEYTWDGETLRWELTPHGDGGCLLVFTNVFDDRDVALPAAAGWHAGLEDMEALLGGRPAGRSAWDRAEELTPAYTASFAAASTTSSTVPASSADL